MNKHEYEEYCKGMFNFCPVPYQLDYIWSCLTKKRIIAVFCRQSGKSESTAKVAIMLARKISTDPVMIFAPTDRQAGLIAEKITNTIKKMFYITDFHIERQTFREFYFSNGGSIICETTGDTGETIRGYTAGAIILEEAGSIKDSIVHYSILPMGAHTDPPIIKIGTPRGMNHFYESFKNGEYVVHQIPWQMAVEQRIVKQDYVDEMKRTLPVDKFRTEMEAEFVPDEDAYFGYNLIEACKKPIEEHSKKGSGKYFLGADIARMGQDSTCMMILYNNGEVNEIVKIIDIPKSTLDFVMDKIIDLHKKYNFAKIYVDETGLGAGVKDVLARKFNPYKPSNVTGHTTSNKMSDIVIGIKFTLQSKLDIFSNLKVMMEQGTIFYPDNKKLISQLRDFRYETTESGNVKLHHSEYGYDDYVDALALAAQGPKTGGFILDW